MPRCLRQPAAEVRRHPSIAPTAYTTQSFWVVSGISWQQGFRRIFHGSLWGFCRIFRGRKSRLNGRYRVPRKSRPAILPYSPASYGPPRTARPAGTFPLRKPGTRSKNVCLAPATADGPAKETIFPLIPVTLSAPPETTFGEDLPSWLRTNLPVVRDESQQIAVWGLLY